MGRRFHGLLLTPDEVLALLVQLGRDDLAGAYRNVLLFLFNKPQDLGPQIRTTWNCVAYPRSLCAWADVGLAMGHEIDKFVHTMWLAHSILNDYYETWFEEMTHG